MSGNRPAAAAARAVKFSDDETFNLINIWKEDAIQRAFKSTTRHKRIYELIAVEHTENGYPRTWKEARNKIKNLKAEYRQKKPEKVWR